MNKNITYYILAFILFIILKFVYVQADNDMVLFMLKPISELITLITSHDAIYSSDIGFFYQKLDITIDKSCSGVNFWLMSFMLCLFSIVSKKKTQIQKIIAFPIAFILAYILTLFANTSRILISLFIEKNTSITYSWLHQAQGIFIYLTFLILFYFLINHILSKSNTHHAKLA